MTKYEALFLRRGDEVGTPDGSPRTVSVVLFGRPSGGIGVGVVHWVTPYMANLWAKRSPCITIRDTNGRLWDSETLSEGGSFLTDRIAAAQRTAPSLVTGESYVTSISMTEEFGFTFGTSQEKEE